MATNESYSDAGFPAVRLACSIVLLSVGYYLGSWLGYVLIFPESYISVIWPPNTVLLVALLLWAPRYWVWLLLAALPVHQLTQMQNGVGQGMAFLYYVYDCAVVLLTAWGLRRFGVSDMELGELRRTLVFIAVTLCAVAVGTLVWSPIIVLMLGGAYEILTSWSLVFRSNAVPFLIAVPCLVAAARRGKEIVRTASLRRWVEFTLLTLGLLICGIGIFSLEAHNLGRIPALLYAPLPLLLWAALRFGPAGLSFASVLFALMTIFGAIAGNGPFVAQSAGDNVLWLQAFLLALYVPLLVMSAVVDERRGKEAALKASEARYRAVVEDQTDLICRFLPDGTYTFVNGAYCRYFQRSADEFLGRTFWDFIPPEAHAASREFLASITPGHAVATIEHRVVASDGQARWQHWTDRGFFDEQGRIIDYQAVGRDITERKLAEEEHRQLEAQTQVAAALRESESRLRQLADAMPQIVWTARPNGSVDYYNRKWYLLTGAAEDETGDRSWLPVVHPDDRQTTLDLWYHAVRDGRPFENELRLKLVNTSEHRWHLARALPVRDDSGNIVRWYGTCTDVHDQKLAEQALRQSEAVLRDANRAKDRFLATLSHELRTPLTPVLLAADAHRHDPRLSDELCRDLNTIYTNAALEVALIDDLLDLTRVGHGKIELHRAAVDIHDLLERSARTCADETFRSKTLRISMELGAGRRWVMGDSTRLSQVFWNVLRNAIKFSDPGTVITVRTADVNATVLCVEVTGSGYGIDPSELSRIFDAFEQGGRDTTRKFGGMGLGLALCKAFVEMHDGRISASSPGRGSGATFRIELPAMETAETDWEPLPAGSEHAAPPQSDLHADEHRGARILLVEDHEFTANLLARLLRTGGHDVFIAHSVATALEAAEQFPIDLVISDLGLPDGTGLALMSQLARERGLRGIALSGYGMEEDLRQSREAGFVEHLVKPVSVQVVQEAIARALARPVAI